MKKKVIFCFEVKEQEDSRAAGGGEGVYSLNLGAVLDDGEGDGVSAGRAAIHRKIFDLGFHFWQNVQVPISLNLAVLWRRIADSSQSH